MFTENITTWAIKATIKNHDFYILILCIVWQIWASWYPKVPGQYGQHPLQDGPIQQSHQVLQDGSWSGLVVFLIFIFMFEGNLVRCRIRTKQCASRLCTTLGSSLSKWVRRFFYPLLGKSIVRTFSFFSLCRSIQRCLLLFWMDHVRTGAFIFCGGTTFSHPLTQKGLFLPPKRPPNILPPKPGRLQNRPPLDLVLLRHRRQRQDEEGLHPTCGDSAWGLKFPVMRQWPFRQCSVWLQVLIYPI